MTRTDRAFQSTDIAPPQRRPLRVAVTGHMQLGDEATIAFVANAFDKLLVQLREEYARNLIALSGLGAGADTLFAETALALSLPLEVCIAAHDLVENFAPGPEREHHLRLRASSTCVHTLPFATRSNGAYMALGYWLVDSCDLLIAAWNGLPAQALGGTGDVVAYALAQGRPILHIHPQRRVIERIA